MSDAVLLPLSCCIVHPRRIYSNNGSSFSGRANMRAHVSAHMGGLDRPGRALVCPIIGPLEREPKYIQLIRWKNEIVTLEKQTRLLKRDWKKHRLVCPSKPIEWKCWWLLVSKKKRRRKIFHSCVIVNFCRFRLRSFFKRTFAWRKMDRVESLDIWFGVYCVLDLTQGHSLK